MKSSFVKIKNHLPPPVDSRYYSILLHAQASRRRTPYVHAHCPGQWYSYRQLKTYLGHSSQKTVKTNFFHISMSRYYKLRIAASRLSIFALYLLCQLDTVTKYMRHLSHRKIGHLQKNRGTGPALTRVNTEKMQIRGKQPQSSRFQNAGLFDVTCRKNL